MSPDLMIATAFVAPLDAPDDQAIIKALARHAKFIRGRVSASLRQMKNQPELRFRLDTSFRQHGPHRPTPALAGKSHAISTTDEDKS